MIGKTISRYSIVSKIGGGGMGEVYLAEDMSLDRKVALKFIPSGMQCDSKARMRFQRDARSAHSDISRLLRSSRTEKPRWARQEALPEIEKLLDKDDRYSAYQLNRQAERYLPGDPAGIMSLFFPMAVLSNIGGDGGGAAKVGSFHNLGATEPTTWPIT